MPLTQKTIKAFREGENPFMLLLSYFLSVSNSTWGVICMVVEQDLAYIASSTTRIDWQLLTERLLPSEYRGTIYEKVLDTKKAFISDKCPCTSTTEINIYSHIPILGNNAIPIGILSVGRNNTNNRYTSDELREVSEYLDLIGILIEHQLLLKKFNASSQRSPDLFIAHMSHEIRTPLNGIVGYIQLLIRQPLTQEQRQYLSAMYQCCLNLIRIINNVLDYSKLASGMLTLEKDCFKLSDCLNDMTSTLSKHLQEKKHNLLLEIAPDVPTTIVMDRQKLLQILINLFSNAIKYTEERGEIKISIQLKGDNMLEIKVKDNGIGIASEDQPTIFQPFANLQHDRHISSTGLGLSITAHLVKALGGDISVYSQIGKGSAFTFTVKFTQPAILAGEIEERLKGDGNVFRYRQVLIVNENPKERVNLLALLGKWQMIATPVSTAQDALAVVEHSPVEFDLGILSGAQLELASTIHKYRPHLPLIAISPNTPSPDFRFSISSPINSIQLYTAILETLKNLFPPSKLVENTGRKILIVEDNNTNSDLLIALLKELKYTNVMTASDGLEAIRLLQKEKFEAMLLDLRMPRLDGYAVLDYIKANAGIFSFNSVVAISASILPQDRVRLKDYGVKHIISKPLDINILRSVLRG
jgi:signal transduction histidine kinase/CheY-like chemotaxis protein